MQYLQLLFFTLTIYFLCFRLLGEFMLPSSNILPRIREMGQDRKINTLEE
jgi:hypothetical protein